MARLGFHGKLPALGDFVSRGWSASFCDALDRFVQTAMAAAYADTPAAVLETQGRAIALSLRPGVLGASGWLGLLMPSEDRVGRYFPICVGLETDENDPSDVRTPNWPSRRWTDELLERVLRVQLDGQGAQALMDALPEVASWALGWSGDFGLSVPGQWRPTGRPLDHPWGLSSDRLPGRDPDEQIAQPISARIVFAGPWEQLSDHQQRLARLAAAQSCMHGVVMAEDGCHHERFAAGPVPNAGVFAALFDGRWRHWGWSLEEACDDTAVTNGDDMDTRPPPDEGTIGAGG